MTVLLTAPPIVDDATRREFLAALAAAGLLVGRSASDSATEPSATRTERDTTVRRT